MRLRSPAGTTIPRSIHCGSWNKSIESKEGFNYTLPGAAHSYLINDEAS